MHPTTVPDHCTQCAAPLDATDFLVCPACEGAACAAFIADHQLVEGRHYERDAQGRVTDFLGDEMVHVYALWLTAHYRLS